MNIVDEKLLVNEFVDFFYEHKEELTFAEAIEAFKREKGIR